MAADAHRQRIERAFTDQAAAFEDRRFNRVFTADAAWVFERLPRRRDDLVLDVAAGTGHAARQLAAGVLAVVAVDATAAMLRRGRDAALADGCRNVVFLRGDAADLPFPDGSFDLAVCRFALHHFEAPAGPLAEMRRCVRAGGRLAVADHVAAAEPATAAVQNELERLRDPSHVRMLDAGELAALAGTAGWGEVSVECRAMARPLAPWLEQARTDAAAATLIRARLDEEIAGGTATGFAPRHVDGELWFAQTFASCIGVAG
jgi:ubiquinone/menaquinone biosynthesis C-methylase UbiE